MNDNFKGLSTGLHVIEARAGITRARSAPKTAATAITIALGIAPAAAAAAPHAYGIRLKGETAQASSSLRYAGLLARVLEISRLPDGWDGRGSKRPSNDAVLHAREIVRRFSNAVPDDWKGSAPLVAPLAPAGFQFEWKNGVRELYVACNEDGTLSFLESTPRADKEYDADMDALNPALKRFIAG